MARNDHTQLSPDPGGDTDPATDIEETENVTMVGAKRKAKRPATSAQKYVPDPLCFAFILTWYCQVEAVTSDGPVRVIIDGAPWCDRTRR